MNSTFIVVGYYTKDTLYEDHARHLESSLSRFNVPYYIQEVQNLGTWLKNTSFKPTFLKQMLEKFKPLNIVYVDVDAEFLSYPVLFDTLDSDISVCVFDRTQYRSPGDKLSEVLSGTVWLGNTSWTVDLVNRWEQRCLENPNEWDQQALEHVLNGQFDELPGEYCKIFDRQPEVIEPVIVHYQASRRVRRRRGNLT